MGGTLEIKKPHANCAEEDIAYLERELGGETFDYDSLVFSVNEISAGDASRLAELLKKPIDNITLHFYCQSAHAVNAIQLAIKGNTHIKAVDGTILGAEREIDLTFRAEMVAPAVDDAPPEAESSDLYAQFSSMLANSSSTVSGWLESADAAVETGMGMGMDALTTSFSRLTTAASACMPGCVPFPCDKMVDEDHGEVPQGPDGRRKQKHQ